MRIPTVLALVLLTACAKDGSKDPNAIGPDPTADGGKVDLTNPDPTNPSTPGADTNISGSRLLRRVYKGTDGSQQFVGWFDSQTKRPCDFQRATDGKLRCLPTSSSANLGLFGDSGCTAPLAFVSKGCAIEPTASFLASGGFCGAATAQRILQTGAQVTTGATIYSGTPAACSAVAPVALTSYLNSYELYLTGAELAPGTFVDATEDHI